MELAFSVAAADLKRAISVVSIVPPLSTPQTIGGYLFTVCADGCFVYSRDGRHEARSSFPTTDVMGEGAFVLPVEAAKALAHVSGPIRFAASDDNGTFTVTYKFGEAGFNERMSCDPRSIHLFERDIRAAQETLTPTEFPVKLLQFGIAVTKPFLPKTTDLVDQEVYKSIRFFGSADPELARANGCVLAANNKERCYLECSAFLDKDLSLPSQHLSLIESFLARSVGNVLVYQTSTKVYMINAKSDVLGWPRHTVEYKRFAYYAKTDEVVVALAADAILTQLKIVRDNLGKEKSKIRMHFDPEVHTLAFSSLEESNALGSDTVCVEPVSVNVSSKLAMSVNVYQLLHMFEGSRSDRVEFRIKVLAADDRRPKDRFLFRTIDSFLLSREGAVVGKLIQSPPCDVEYPPEGVYECRVTRFAPGID